MRFWPFGKQKPPPNVAGHGHPATINGPVPELRLQGRMERLRSAINRLGDGAKRQALQEELAKLERDQRKIEAAAAIDREG